MNQAWRTSTCALCFSYLALSAIALAEPLKTASKGTAAEEIIASYRGDGSLDAREVAEADRRYALDQLAAARAEVKGLISEIRIEGAETVDIGGEVRAARMVEAAWQRAVETVSDHIVRLDSKFARR
jgi:hypothetical protein